MVFGELRSAVVPALSVAVVVLGRTAQLPGPPVRVQGLASPCVPEPQFPN